MDKIILAGNNGTLISANIYKPTKGKNKDVHMIDFKISKNYVPSIPLTSDTHKEFMKVIRTVREKFVDESIKSVDLNYMSEAHHFKYRVF